MNVFLGLGSNLGQREQNLRNALAELRGLPRTRIQKISSFYDTVPVGCREQNNFLNAAVQLYTALSAPRLLAATQAIEKKLGRVKTFHWGPRLIDIDILAYGGRIIDRTDLQIPHRELPRRRFVLAPLCEIAPDALDARSQKTYRQLLAALA